jgi:hypothetical protein
MFGPSLKSVPGCLVSIVPRSIGVPVAATPGFVPHDEVFTDADGALALELLAALVAGAALLVLALLALLLLLLLLLPQPAMTPIANTPAMTALSRASGAFWWIRTDLSSSSDLGLSSPHCFLK